MICPHRYTIHQSTLTASSKDGNLTITMTEESQEFPPCYEGDCPMWENGRCSKT